MKTKQQFKLKEHQNSVWASVYQSFYPCHCHIIPYGQITSSKLREGFNHSQHDLMINTLCERFEPRSHFISRLSMIVCPLDPPLNEGR